jgi:hypothetical protein
MNQSKIAVRYSKALFNLAIEKGLLNELKNDIQLVALACKEANFQRLLESPVVKTSQKKTLLKEIFSGKVNPLTTQFLLMVAIRNCPRFYSTVPQTQRHTGGNSYHRCTFGQRNERTDQPVDCKTVQNPSRIVYRRKSGIKRGFYFTGGRPAN